MTGSKFARKLDATEREAIGATIITAPWMSGPELQALGERHGVSAKWVERLRLHYAREHGIDKISRPHGLTLEQRREVVRLIALRRSLSNKRLARRFGVTEHLVKHLADKTSPSTTAPGPHGTALAAGSQPAALST